MRFLRFASFVSLGAALVASASAQKPHPTSRERILYAACYLFDGGKPQAAYLPVQKTTGWHAYNHFEGQVRKRLSPNAGDKSVECRFGDTAADAEAARIKTGYYKAADILWPEGFMPTAPGDRPSEAVAKTGTGAKDATKKSSGPGALTPETETAPAKYIEVQGPNGVIRLSPEVADRNKAAEEEYQRKSEAHAEVIAQAERDAAKHAQNVAKAAAEKREYERQLAANAAQVAAHKAKMENYNKNPTLAGGPERTFQATSKFRATREEAMYEMTSHPRAPISNVQCKEVTFYKPARWTCWGTYQQAVSQSSTSKQ